MVFKQPIDPERIRKIPRQFSWLDHRLVSEHYIDRCTHRGAALYLFLVTVADARGVSYYSDRTFSQRLSMDEQALIQSRGELVGIGLIAYRKPKDIGSGRNAGRPAPPAQIPACATNALGSYLGYNVQTRKV